MLQIFAVMIAAYVLFKVGVSFIKEKLMARQMQEELNDVTQALGFETYGAGSVFDSVNFRMPMEVTLYALDSLLNDSLVFAVIAQGRPGDRAGIIVTKQLVDRKKTLFENWQYFQQQSSGLSERLKLMAMLMSVMIIRKQYSR